VGWRGRQPGPARGAVGAVNLEQLSGRITKLRVRYVKIMKDNCFSSVSQSDLNVLDWPKLSAELDLAERPLKDLIESLNKAQKDVLDRLAVDIEASFDDHEQHIVALERKVESAEALLKNVKIAVKRQSIKVAKERSSEIQAMAT